MGGKNRGNFFTGCSDPLSQSIGRGRILVGWDIACCRESRDWSDEVFAPAEKTQVWLIEILEQ